MRITTWNINSVRLRMPLLKKLAAEENPDIICLQETKVVDELFPLADIKSLGYQHVEFRGEKGYNGVAILSKFPLVQIGRHDIANAKDCRHISAILPDGTELHNFYIPAGGDEPDVVINPKYKFKLEFVEHMTEWFGSNRKPSDKIVILGDFNIAPFEHDVWSHKQLKNVVSHTEPEITRLHKMRESLDWVDVGRHFVPMDEKSYSWWSYRNKDWKTSNRGRRLDHIWVTPALQNNLQSYKVLADARDWEQPSDHVPVVVGFK
jgi:exodeoxyribonuclease-3